MKVMGLGNLKVSSKILSFEILSFQVLFLQRRIMKMKPELHDCNYRLEWIDHVGDKVPIHIRSDLLTT